MSRPPRCGDSADQGTQPIDAGQRVKIRQACRARAKRVHSAEEKCDDEEDKL